MHKEINYSPKQIEDAFQLLDIEPTLDKSKINSAWKNKAIHYHPDKVKSIFEKEEYHIKFINLIEARDICLSIIKLSSNLVQNSNEKYSQNKYETENIRRDNKQEYEWEEFVKNEKKYFSSRELINLAISSFFEISFHSIIVSMLSSSILGICMLLILGFFSMIPELPFFVWILSPISLLFLVFYTSFYLDYVDTFILKKLIHIGYPFKYYIVLWILENIIFISLLLFTSKESIFIFLVGNLGFAIQFHRIKSRIQDIEEILKTYSTLKDLI